MVFRLKTAIFRFQEQASFGAVHFNYHFKQEISYLNILVLQA